MVHPIVNEIKPLSAAERIAAHHRQVRLVRASLVAVPPKPAANTPVSR